MEHMKILTTLPKEAKGRLVDSGQRGTRTTVLYLIRLFFSPEAVNIEFFLTYIPFSLQDIMPWSYENLKSIRRSIDFYF